MTGEIFPEYGTYMPALIEIVGKTTGPILECGTSVFSTPFLHFACYETKRKLLSYENDPDKYATWRSLANDYHQINFVPDWANIDVSGHWSLALIDHEPKISRKAVIRRLSQSADYILIHDSQGRLDKRYKYSEIYPLFNFRKDFTSQRPFTTLLSNFVDLSNPEGTTAAKVASDQTNLTTIIFSKNRACQLDLLLRSLNIPAIVQYTCDPQFQAGYDKVMKMYPDTRFARETNFKDQLTQLVADGSEYVMFLVDDDVMVRPFDEASPEFAEFRRNPDILSLSLRQSPDYQYRGQPELTGNKWHWRPYDRRSETFNYRLRTWGCPMGVGANIFRASDVLSIFARVESIDTPSFLERELTYNAPNRPLAMCYDKAKFVNVEANQVQTDFRAHTHGQSLEELEQLFLAGNRVSLEHIRGLAQTTQDYFLQTEYQFENNSL